jgi:membrane protein DedA with SNARE-associated domain
MFESLFKLFTEIISTVGYAGVFVLMTLESMVAPVPSEGVMPFAGYLVTTGKFNMAIVIVSSSIGSIFGSLISYYIGACGGKPFILKYGKYLLLDKHHLEITERFFEKYGEKTIFFSRFIPVVRHFISIPAGIGKMNLPKFCIYTIAGAAMWNAFLAYTGVWLGVRWELVHKYTKYLDILVILIAAAFIGHLVYKHIKGRKK